MIPPTERQQGQVRDVNDLDANEEEEEGNGFGAFIYLKTRTIWFSDAIQPTRANVKAM